jgi:hypothetical protein
MARWAFWACPVLDPGFFLQNSILYRNLAKKKDTTIYLKNVKIGFYTRVSPSALPIVLATLSFQIIFRLNRLVIFTAQKKLVNSIERFLKNVFMNK